MNVKRECSHAPSAKQLRVVGRFPRRLNRKSCGCRIRSEHMLLVVGGRWLPLGRNTPRRIEWGHGVGGGSAIFLVRRGAGHWAPRRPCGFLCLGYSASGRHCGEGAMSASPHGAIEWHGRFRPAGQLASGTLAPARSQPTRRKDNLGSH